MKSTILLILKTLMFVVMIYMYNHFVAKVPDNVSGLLAVGGGSIIGLSHSNQI